MKRRADLPGVHNPPRPAAAGRGPQSSSGGWGGLGRAPCWHRDHPCAVGALGGSLPAPAPGAGQLAPLVPASPVLLAPRCATPAFTTANPLVLLAVRALAEMGAEEGINAEPCILFARR